MDYINDLSTVSASEENGSHQTITSHLQLTDKKIDFPEFISAV
jgi:hypothetical protein